MINLTGNKYKPLTPEEVQELWPKAHQGDEKARERLICSTLRSVVAECYRYASKFDVDELISMALVVAVEAFDKFDPAKGMQFYSFVVVSVRWKIGVELHRNRVETVCTDDERLLESLGGYAKPTDTDEERHREKRNTIIVDYLHSLANITPEMVDYALKRMEGNSEAQNGILQRIYGAARRTQPTPEILQAITELIGADTAAKVVQGHEDRQRQNIESLENRREWRREYNKKKYEEGKAIRAERKAQKEAARLALAEQRKNDRIQARMKRELDKAHAKELKAIERQKTALQRIMEKQKTERQTAVDNFNTLYDFIITHTDARPMEAEAAAYMTLQGFDTLKAWSDRHGLVYESVKRWRMYVKRKLAALNDIDADIIALDRSLFKS